MPDEVMPPREIKILATLPRAQLIVRHCFCEREWQMENRKLLNYLPTRLRNIPILGAILAGYLTFLAICAAYFLPRFEMFSGEGSLIVFFIVYPLTLSGMVFATITDRVAGLNLERHPQIASWFVSIVAIILNMVLVWAALTSLGTVCRIFRSFLREWPVENQDI
jgi:hypothetical protein